MTEHENNNGQSSDPWTKNPQVKEQENPSWEKELITKLAMGALTEQRRARRWGIFFKFFMVAYLLVFVALLLPDQDGIAGMGKKHTALIELKGEISDSSEASADNIVTSLRDAFENTHTAGVILRINSPGGSPVQAGYINDEIKRLRGLHPNIPLYAVVTDLCASGGYYVAVAADEIYVDKASIVGSIGVVMGSFGFVNAMKKLGVERRLLTAGESKGFLDPFSPLKEKDAKHIHGMLDNIHQQFIATVKEGRGDRLKENDALFTGLVWTGEQSIEMGLADGLGSASYVAREIIGEENIVDYTVRPDPFIRLAERFGVVMAETFAKVTGMEAGAIR
jgi:protease-4